MSCISRRLAGCVEVERRGEEKARKTGRKRGKADKTRKADEQGKGGWMSSTMQLRWPDHPYLPPPVARPRRWMPSSRTKNMQMTLRNGFCAERVCMWVGAFFFFSVVFLFLFQGYSHTFFVDVVSWYSADGVGGKSCGIMAYRSRQAGRQDRTKGRRRTINMRYGESWCLNIGKKE